MLLLFGVQLKFDMKITVGLDGSDNPKGVLDLSRGGADEFFAGFIPHEWYSRYGWEVSLSRRENGAEYVFTDYKQLGEVISAVHDQGKSIYIALNYHQYVNEQLPLIKSIVQNVEKFNPDGYIIADLAMMLTLREWGIRRPLNLSTGAANFNSESIRYFNDKVGVSRVVIPRKMSLEEMGLLIEKCKDLSVEFEVMVIHYRCFFNDEYCLSWHSGNCNSLCCYFMETLKHSQKLFPHSWKQILEEALNDSEAQFKEGSPLDKFIKYTYSISNDEMVYPRTRDEHREDGLHFYLASQLFKSCGLCAIGQLKDMGVSVLKVPLRGEHMTKKKILQIVRKVLDSPSPSRKFCRDLIDSPAFCSDSINCYYYLGG